MSPAPTQGWRARLAFAVLALAGVLTGVFVGYTYAHGGAQFLPLLAGLVVLNVVIAVPLQLVLHNAQERAARRKGRPMAHQPWHAGWKMALASFGSGILAGLGAYLIQHSLSNGAA